MHSVRIYLRHRHPVPVVVLRGTYLLGGFPLNLAKTKYSTQNLGFNKPCETACRSKAARHLFPSWNYVSFMVGYFPAFGCGQVLVRLHIFQLLSVQVTFQEKTKWFKANHACNKIVLQHRRSLQHLWCFSLCFCALQTRSRILRETNMSFCKVLDEKETLRLGVPETKDPKLSLPHVGTILYVSWSSQSFGDHPSFLCCGGLNPWQLDKTRISKNGTLVYSVGVLAESWQLYRWLQKCQNLFTMHACLWLNKLNFAIAQIPHCDAKRLTAPVCVCDAKLTYIRT